MWRKNELSVLDLVCHRPLLAESGMKFAEARAYHWIHQEMRERIERLMGVSRKKSCRIAINFADHLVVIFKREWSEGRQEEWSRQWRLTHWRQSRPTRVHSSWIFKNISGFRLRELLSWKLLDLSRLVVFLTELCSDEILNLRRYLLSQNLNRPCQACRNHTLVQ